MIRFLDLSLVLEIHIEQLAEFGGLPGIRDPGMLQSAVMNPQSSMGGEYLYENVIAMAAAYATSLVRNYPFLDGNKRVGAAAAILFLELNGYLDVELDAARYEDKILRLAAGLASRDDMEAFLRAQLVGQGPEGKR